MKHFNHLRFSRRTTMLVVSAVITIGIIGIWGTTKYSISNYQIVTKPTATATPSPAVSKTESVISGKTTTDRLLFLIEEEKLAHDVYEKLNDLWGAQVFGNILKSEQTHQSRVLTLLQARNIADPRTGTVGTFTNTDLQKLYDDLMLKGAKSAQDAYEVGVAIEEKDIADITNILSDTTGETDVVAALEDLRKGSENHLRAFNRQLDRVR